MKLLTLIALKRSIKKWERIVEGTGVDLGPDNCALCKRFLNVSDPRGTRCTRKNGERCPVDIAANEPSCLGTPYEAWSAWVDPDDDGRRAVCNEHTRFMAKEELNFLKSLLPEKKK